MRTEVVIGVVVLAAAGVWAFANRSKIGLAPPSRADQLRDVIGRLPAERTAKEIAAQGDRTLAQNVGKYAMEGSVGGYWGAAGGVVVGVFAELFD